MMIYHEILYRKLPFLVSKTTPIPPVMGLAGRVRSTSDTAAANASWTPCSARYSRPDGFDIAALQYRVQHEFIYMYRVATRPALNMAVVFAKLSFSYAVVETSPVPAVTQNEFRLDVWRRRPGDWLGSTARATG